MRLNLKLLLIISLAASAIVFARPGPSAPIRDGGIDPANMGKGDWLYSITDATNKLGNHVLSVTNETSLMLYYKKQGIRYMIIKAATGASLFNGCYSFPQFTSNLVSIAHANGILIFGYNRSYATNVVGELAVIDYIFAQGADGFVWDAEAEWESATIGSQGPSLAWQQCSIARSNYPNKFLAHAPFPIIYLHSSFPYKEFGFWCDAVMPQIYHFSATKGSQSAGINWSDVNWKTWQSSLFSLPATNINGVAVNWTNSIRPIVPINDVYGPFTSSPCEGGATAQSDLHVMEFIDYLAADPWPQTAGGYKGVNFWRTDLHGTNQWMRIQAGTSGSFPGIVNNIVIDNPNATVSGAWTSVFTWSNVVNKATFVGNGSGTETNSFGTNYLFRPRGNGTAYVQFQPNIVVGGDYDIYQWHPSLTNASAAVPFIIQYNGGAATVNANQQTNAGNWSLLGRFNFAPGNSGTIQVTDQIPETNAIAIVDGLKLVFASSNVVAVAAPTNLMASAISYSQVALSWSDNATNELMFVVSRGTNAGGAYQDIVTLPANSTNYTDTNLLELTTYYYVVRAASASIVSTNSNEATAFTPAINPQPPLIGAQPVGVAALPGQSVTFSVAASGTRTLRYQWRFAGVFIPGATNSSLLIPLAAQTNVGIYSVMITNIYGATNSADASLNLIYLAGIGDDSQGQRLVPPAATNLAGIAAGLYHSLALRGDGTVIAWGNNLGGASTVPPDLGDTLAIAGGGYHSLALGADSRVRAWGENDYGQTNVPAGLSAQRAIAAGLWHNLSLGEDGVVRAWGDDSKGQCEVPTDLVNVVAIAAGGSHSLALTRDGTVLAWGENTDPTGTFAGQSVVPSGLTNVRAIAAGSYHSLALRADGTIAAWGDNSQGQCDVPPGLTNVIGIRAGAAHNLALRADGSLAAWGANWNSQCDFPPGITNWALIAAGGYHSLALLDGQIAPPRIVASSRQPGDFNVKLPTVFRKNYALESLTDLGGGSWIGRTNAPGNAEVLILDDPSAPFAARFYRVRRW